MDKFFSGKALKPGKPSGILAGDFRFSDEAERQKAIEYADKALSEPFPQLTATMYMRFTRDGNRSAYDGAAARRRGMIMSLLLGVLAGEKKKYTDKLIDCVWATCEDTSWVIPAHNVSRPYVYNKNPLPDSYDGDAAEVDLFSAETGAVLAFVYIYAKDILDAETAVICERIAYEIRRRIIRPFLDHEMRWITGFINNWVPWIVSNVLVCASVFSGAGEQEQVLAQSARYLDIFISTYGDDGGCNEGCSYWNAAVATLFDAAEIIADLTGDDSVFARPGFKRMAEFAFDMCIKPDENLFVNFADCSPRLYYNRRLIARMAKKLKSDKLGMLSEMLGDPPTSAPGFMQYRYLKSLTEPLPAHAAKALPDSSAVYPDLQVAALRRGGFFLAAKGGHNRESHNHNDVGSIILYCDGEPVLIDAGVGTYRKETFSNARYTLWTMQSSFHNLPEINGSMQKDGEEYRADRFECEGDAVRIDYAKAYPEEAGVKLARRDAVLTAGGLTVSDTVDPGTAVFNFLTKYKPVETAPLTYAVGNCTVRFDRGEAAIEEIDLEGDGTLESSWKQERIYRIRVKAAGLVTTVTRQ
ncbi:MAG: heparinase II/III family protein [Clostridia bacterium]|nr:heparinase II/III family protein [Clostridia bacterium]